MYHCECIKQLRERGVTDTCPQCRARLPPGPGQCYAEAARLLIRADRVQQSSGEQARELCVQAAALLEQVLQEEPGHVHAQCNLGCCYEHGNGVPRDMGQAVVWYRKAAEQGHSGAQYNLSACYTSGEGVPRDMVQAVGWLRKAAEQGPAVAQEVLLGLHLPEEGEGGGGAGVSGGGL
jgi:TPR repeat protein